MTNSWTDEAVPITMSPLCQTITQDGYTLEVLIYDDGAAGWLLEVVDAHGTSVVWDESFTTDQEALAELFTVLNNEEDIEGLFNSVSDSGATPPATNSNRALIETFLREQNNPKALSYFQTCGFLFAVSCCPELVPPSDWIPMLTGGNPSVDKLDGDKAGLGALLSLYNHINEDIAEQTSDLPTGIQIQPAIRDNFGKSAELGQWSSGFVRGVAQWHSLKRFFRNCSLDGVQRNPGYKNIPACHLCLNECHCPLPSLLVLLAMGFAKSC